MKIAKNIPLLAALLLGTTASTSGQTDRDYQYDSIGNRTSATNQIRFTSTDAFTVQPERATVGDLVNIYGRNFDPADAPLMAVTFGGVPGTIESVAPRVVTVTIPVGAMSGSVILSIPNQADADLGVVLVQGLEVSPDVAEVTFGQQVQFTATVTGANNMTVDWDVNGIPGGDANVGTITAGGLYTAPQAGSPVDYPYLVRATNQRLQQSAYAVVKPACSNALPISDEIFESGTLAAPGQRDCWEFNGSAWEKVYVAVIAPNGSVFRLNLRDSGGALLATTGPGQRLKLSDVLLTEDDVYRIEIESDNTPPGDYQVWLNQHGELPDGIWMFPADEYWDDPRNWSNDSLPGLLDPVVIADFPGDMTVFSASGGLCAGISCAEEMRLQGGSIVCNFGDVQVDRGIELAGGALEDATVLPGIGGAGFTITANSNNALRGITTSLDLMLDTPSARVRLDQVTLTGEIHLSASSTEIGFEGDQNWTSGDIFFDGTAGSNRYINMVAPGHVTIGPNVTISGQRGTLGGSFWWNKSMWLENHGLIQSNAPNGTLTLSTKETRNPGGTLSAVNDGRLLVPTMDGEIGNVSMADAGSEIVFGGVAYENAGAITVPDGTILTLEGNWINSGSILPTNSTVNLDGTFATAAVGTITGSGATVNIEGICDNSGATFSMDGATGTWLLANGGQILGGTVEMLGGAELNANSHASNRLDGVTLNGDLRLGASSSRVRLHDFIINGTAYLSGASSSIGLEGDTNWTTGNIVFEGAGGNRYISMETAGTFMIGPGVTITGGRGNVGGNFWWTQAMTFDNQGTVHADVGGQSITIGAASTSNGDQFQATSGGDLIIQNMTGAIGNILVDGSGSVMSFDGSGYTNAGAVSVTNGAALTFDGTWNNTSSITIDNSTLNLDGSFTNAGMGTIVNTAGTVNVLGSMDNTAAVLSLDGTLGLWRLSGGEIVGGTVDVLPGGELRASSSATNRLENVTLNGDLMISDSSGRVRVAGVVHNGATHITGSSASIGFEGDQTWTGDIRFAGNSTAYLSMQAAGTVTLAPGASIFGDGNGNIGGSFWWTQPMTFVNQGTVHARTNLRTITIAAAAASNADMFMATAGGDLVVNNMTGTVGDLTVDGSATVMRFDGTGYSNNGSVNVTNGATLTFDGMWANTTGTVAVDSGSTLNLGGMFTNSGIGAIANTGGTVNITGSLDNSAAVLALDGSSGVWRLLGGEIVGGTVTLTGGAELRAGSNANNRLENVIVNGDVSLSESTARVRIAGVTLNGTAHITGSSASIGFEGDQTLSGTIRFGGSSTAYLSMQAAGTVTLAPGATILGEGNGNIGGSFWWSQPMTFVNHGTVHASTNARTITIAAAAASNAHMFQATGGGDLIVNNMTGTVGGVTVDGAGSVMSFDGTGYSNNGTVDVTNGATLAFNGSWTNTSGTVAVDNSTFNLGGTVANTGIGTISNVGGTVNITGSLDNSAAVLALDGGSGLWRLFGGEIVGGTVTLTGGAELHAGTSSSNRLQDVILNGDLMLSENSARVRVANVIHNGATHMASSSTSIGFEGDQTWTGDIHFESASVGYLSMQSGGTVTLAPGATIFGEGNGNIGGSFWWSQPMTFVNQGTVHASTNTRTITIAAAAASNANMFQATGGGDLVVSSMTGTIGDLTVDGASSVMSLNGTGHSNNGTVDVTNGATLTLDGTWDNTSGTIAVDSGTLNLDGTFANSGVGTITNVAGTVNIAGSMDNSAATLALDGGSGLWRLFGGEIIGGTVTLTGGAELVAGPSSSNRLENVVLNGDLMFSESASRVRVDGLVLNGTAHLDGSSVSMGFEGDQTWSVGDIDFGSNGGTGYLSMQSPGTLTIGPGVTISGTSHGNIGGSFWWSQAMTFVNQGIVESSATNRTITLAATSTANTGTFEASGGGHMVVQQMTGPLGHVVVDGTSSLMSFDGTSYSNAGTISPTGGSELVFDGGWTNAAGTVALTDSTLGLDGAFTNTTLGTITSSNGTVNLLGSLDNSSATLALGASSGTWRLLGGEIVGGTVDVTAGAEFHAAGNSANRLEDVTVNGDLMLPEGGSRVRVDNVTLNGTANLTGSSSSIGFEGTTNWTTGDIVFGTGSPRHLSMQTAGTLTIGPGVTLTGGAANIGGSFWWGESMSLVHQGTLIASTTNQTITLAASTISNEGTMQATGSGRIVASNLFTTTGDVVIDSGSLMTAHSGYDQNGGTTTVDGDLSSNAGVDLFSGTLLGTGDVNANLLNDGATVSPGGSAGNLDVVGTYTQTSAGALDIEIGGLVPDTEHDRLAITGATTFDGTLNLSVINSFVPQLNDAFDVVTYASRTGTFSTVTGTNLGAGTQFSPAYGATALTIDVIPFP